MKSEWAISYENDVGPEDEYFCEWWNVSNGKVTFRCDSKKEAHRLAKLLEREDEVNEAPRP